MNWPTEKLHRAVNKPYCKIGEQIRIWLSPDVEDVTHEPEVQQQLRDFAPDIRQLGLGLYNERRGRLNTWGGLLVRGVETQPEIQPRRRCLQYIYIWTKQQSAVSLFWMVIVPVIMGLWGFLVRELYGPHITIFQQEIQLDFWGTLLTPSNLLLPMLATGFVSLPLLLSSIWDHRWDLYLGTGFSFRSTTLLVPFSIMMWFVAFSWIVPALILGFGLIVCGLYWILDKIGFTSTSHLMDYLPVFVWLKFDEVTGWKLEQACWDRHHYSIECKKAEDLSIWRSKTIETEERVRLQMDNPWHSVRPGGSVQNIYLFLSIIGLIIFIPVALLQFTQNQYLEFFNGGLIFVISCFIIVLGFRTIMRTSSELMTSHELRVLSLPSKHHELNELSEKTKNHLNEKRLNILWNLEKTQDTGHWLSKRIRYIIRRGKEFPPDVRPRFVVITKLQDPFNYYNLPRYYDTFRDDLDYLYLYISSRCPMTEEDRRRSLESKIELQREGYHIEPQAQFRFEAAQMAMRGRVDARKMARDLIKEIDHKKERITKEQIEEFREKRKY